MSSREPAKQKGLVTVSCIDGRWFQAKIGNPALPANRVPLSVPEWEMRNALALLAVAAGALDGAPWLARFLRLPGYKRAQHTYHQAAEQFAAVADRSKSHQKAAERLQAGFRVESKGKAQP